MPLTTPRRRAIASLFDASLAKKARAGVIFSWLLVVGLAGAMLIIRSADGPHAFLEGVVVRGISLHLFFASLPFAFALAKGAASFDSPRATLLALRGFTQHDIELAAPRSVLILASKRIAWPASALAILAALLSISDRPHLVRHLAACISLIAIAIIAAAALAALGVLASRIAPKRGRTLFFVVVLLPWMLSVLPSVPREISLPGAYEEVVRLVLVHVAP